MSVYFLFIYLFIFFRNRGLTKKTKCVVNHYSRLFKYIENFTTKKEKLSDKIILYFSHFCSKHRLWVLVRGGSNRYPQSMFLSRNKNKSCRRTASSPAGYILYCNIFIIKLYNIGHTDLDVFVCKSFCHIDIIIQV